MSSVNNLDPSALQPASYYDPSNPESPYYDPTLGQAAAVNPSTTNIPVPPTSNDGTATDATKIAAPAEKHRRGYRRQMQNQQTLQQGALNSLQQGVINSQQQTNPIGESTPSKTGK